MADPKEQTELEECLQSENDSLRDELGDIYARMLQNGGSVRVLIALDEDAHVAECIVLTDEEKAEELFTRLKRIWGGANVCMAARAIDDIPANLSKEVPIVHSESNN